MNFLFAWRYFKSKKTTNAINIIAWISVLAIAVGTASLIIVLSVFNGFESLVQSLYGDFYADMQIVPATGSYATFSPAFIKQVQQVNGIKTISFEIEEKAVLVNGPYQAIVYLKGVDENFKHVSNLSEHVIRGKYDLGTTDKPLLVSGVGVENATGADPEAKMLPDLVVYLPNRKATDLSNLDAMHSYNVQPSGTYMVQQDFDDKYVFTNLAFMQYMLDLKPDEYSSIELSLNNNDDAKKIKQQLQSVAGKDFIVQTRYEQNQSLFTAMQIEKWVIYAILALILLVASFNMIGALTMLVLEKQKDIAVLKAMGADNNRIQKIFLNEGFVLAGVGGLSGMLLAFIICALQMKFKLIKLQGGTFLIDYYPVKMYATDFILVTLTVVTVAILAAWIPSRKASVQEFSLKS
jgi:lipoprotein-releasing system permease protein